MSVLAETNHRTHWVVMLDGDSRGRMYSTEEIAVQVARLWMEECADVRVEQRPGMWVPPSMRKPKENPRVVYEEYIRSPSWKAKATEAKRRAENRCQFCYSAENIQAHHRTYDRLGYERPSDITVLCDKCHEWHHKADRGRQLAEVRANEEAR